MSSGSCWGLKGLPLAGVSLPWAQTPGLAHQNCYQTQVHVPNSEAKQIKTSEFGAEKVYCRAKQGECMAHAKKKKRGTLMVFGENFYRQNFE